MTPAPASRPSIFISATSGDLGPCRQVIKEALLTIGCIPVEQTSLPPDSQRVREILRAKLAECQAVVHVAGLRYGAEPQERGAQEARRSYTQMEYDMAREMGLPVYVFLCGADFPYAACDPESEVLQALQLEHRRQLMAGDALFEEIGSLETLELRIHALQERVERLKRELARTRSWLGRGLAVGLVLALLLGAGLYWQSQRTSANEEKLAAMETEMEAQRNHIRSAAAAFMELKVQLADQNLSNEELWARAMEQAAQKSGIPLQELQAGIELFTVAVGQDQSASRYDAALAQFAKGDFAAAGDLAILAAEEAKQQMQANLELQRQLQETLNKSRIQQRDSLVLAGQSRHAEGRFGEAVEAFQLALEPNVTSLDQDPIPWIELQMQLGIAAQNWTIFAEGKDVATRLEMAAEACRQALAASEKYGFESRAAESHAYLGACLFLQSGVCDDADRIRILKECEASYRIAIEILDPEIGLDAWATAQANLGSVMQCLAEAANGDERDKLFAEARAAYQAALEVHSRDSHPIGWASTQSKFSTALTIQASCMDGPEADQTFQRAEASLNAVLEVYSRVDFPKEWAVTQFSLGNNFAEWAEIGHESDRKVRLEQAIDAYRSGLQIMTRKVSPQDWARTHCNMGSALHELAETSSGETQARYFKEANESIARALDVFTRDDMPQEWADAIGLLARTLTRQADLANPSEQPSLFDEAITAYRSVLEVRSRNSSPEEWAKAQFNLATSLRSRARFQEGQDWLDTVLESEAATELALEELTLESFPRLSAQIHTFLGLLLIEHANRVEGSGRAPLLDRAESAL
ncbi:MAG: DUF4062 domain-containing protein, partial [Planctomycetes bacterium]|nr:DUF4062 domain-containing protein [Planctomycetota bacterium]